MGIIYLQWYSVGGQSSELDPGSAVWSIHTVDPLIGLHAGGPLTVLNSLLISTLLLVNCGGNGHNLFPNDHEC